MDLFERLTLRKLLTLPYVVLVVLLALVIGALSYRASQQAIDDLSARLVSETVGRIRLATLSHIDGSQAVLESAFPAGLPAPTTFDDAELAVLRRRFWIATTIHRDPNNYAYYGDAQGRFFGLLRHTEHEAELRLRATGEGPRSLYRFSGIDGDAAFTEREQRVFDPRQRPWYAVARDTRRHRWTPIYIDFKTGELVATRVRRVDDAHHQPAGVVATDLSLQRLSTFLRRLDISPNAVAYVTEADGSIVASSRSSPLRKDAEGKPQRINAASSDDALIAASYHAVQKVATSDQSDGAMSRLIVRDDQNGSVQIGHSALRDDADLSWRIVVAVPRNDFLGNIQKNLINTLWLSLAAAAAAVLLGLAIVSTVSRELRNLASAARRVGDGHEVEPTSLRREDELGDLARSFSDMQSRLITDQLTGLQNRAAVLRAIEERITQHRRQVNQVPFAILFADLNGFKQINDRFGHDVGDAVLRELASRMRRSVRTRDLVARYAGDEFVIVLDAIDHPRDADTVRSNLEASLREPLLALSELSPGFQAEGATFGVATYPENGQDVETLIKHADDDMYRRKGITRLDGR